MHTPPAGGEVVTKFVNENQNPQDEGEGQNSPDQIMHDRYAISRRPERPSRITSGGAGNRAKARYTTGFAIPVQYFFQRIGPLCAD